MKTVAIIQARMGSSRLPGKVLAPLGEHPMLWHIVQRAQAAQEVDKVVVATTTLKADDAIATHCQEWGVSCFRGSTEDVLERFCLAARQFDAQIVVRLTADCPLLDPEIIDGVCKRRAEGDYECAFNNVYPLFPDGLDVEVASAAALERAMMETQKPSDREHVTIYLKTSGRFRSVHYRDLERHYLPQKSRNFRWTVDTPQDLRWMERVFAALETHHQKKPDLSPFSASHVYEVLQTNAKLLALMPSTIWNEGYYQSLYHHADVSPTTPLRLEESEKWRKRALEVIPGVAQTFSKSPDQYVRGVSPVFLESGVGCRVKDVDGNSYIDYVQGLLPNILGYAHPEVNAAAQAQLTKGHSFSLPHPIEVELAEKLVEIIPCAEMVRFGKNGSDATAGAVRVARAFTGRERIACCGYHGWQDWYIGSTTRAAGVPLAVRELTHPFPYNDLARLQELLEIYPGAFAAVILEPVNFVEPEPTFLSGARALAHQHGALLIFDEICSGWHLGLGGAQKLFGVVPDLACFGKAMGNGWPISAVVGRREIMRVFEESFFSFTFAGEVASMAAAQKVIEILENTDALMQMQVIGRRLQDGFNALAQCAGLSERFQCVGRPAWSLLKFRGEQNQDGLLERSLWSQECVKRGILQLVTHNMSAAHDDAVAEETLATYAAVFKTLSGWLSDSRPDQHLQGPSIQPVFRVRG